MEFTNEVIAKLNANTAKFRESEGDKRILITPNVVHTLNTLAMLGSTEINIPSRTSVLELILEKEIDSMRSQFPEQVAKAEELLLTYYSIDPEDLIEDSDITLTPSEIQDCVGLILAGKTLKIR